MTNAWLLDGEYELESRGELYKADIHVKTPFDPANNRLQGYYEADQAIMLSQQQKTNDYKNLLSRASARFYSTNSSKYS